MFSPWLPIAPARASRARHVIVFLALDPARGWPNPRRPRTRPVVARPGEAIDGGASGRRLLDLDLATLLDGDDAPPLPRVRPRGGWRAARLTADERVRLGRRLAELEPGPESDQLRRVRDAVLRWTGAASCAPLDDLLTVLVLEGFVPFRARAAEAWAEDLDDVGALRATITGLLRRVEGAGELSVILPILPYRDIGGAVPSDAMAALSARLRWLDRRIAIWQASAPRDPRRLRV